MNNLFNIQYDEYGLQTLEQIYPIVVETITDWNMVLIAFLVGLLSTVATIFAVVLTNKRTTELYERSREDDRRQNAMVILKPVLKLTTFWSILDSLILKDTWDRVLLLERDDRFDYYTEPTLASKTYRLLSVRNENINNVSHIKITLTSDLKIDDNLESGIRFDKTYVIKYFRAREEILLPIYGSLQESKIREKHTTEKTYNLNFSCIIEYMTIAEQCITYNYGGSITTLVKIGVEEVDGKKEEYNYFDHDVVISNDYPTIKGIDFKMSDTEDVGRPFINLQDKIAHVDRANYIHRKIGEAQIGVAFEKMAPLLEPLINSLIRGDMPVVADSVEDTDKDTSNAELLEDKNKAVDIEQQSEDGENE